MDNIFHRTELLLGPDGLKSLKKSHVAVFGLGGVGSFAAESLARAGVGTLTVVDFDDVGETNVNRQSLAFLDTIGKPKVEIMAARIKRINPECEVIIKKEFFSEDNSEQMLATKFDAVVDAIDSFNPKIHLLVECLKRSYPVVSAMGAAGKIDPGKIRTADISKSTICPLARRVRKRLRAFDITTGFKVVYSIEPPVMPFEPSSISKEHHEKCLQRGRVRMVQGTISYLPAIFGLMLSGLVVQEITGYETAKQTPSHKEKLQKINKQ
jgi:tRNA A37 threonylcarbamoyladenosine dehydratase